MADNLPPVKKLTNSDTCSRVIDNLYVGGSYAAENLELIKELGVTTIIVIKETDLLAKAPTIQYRHYQYRDEIYEPLHEKFDEIADHINSERTSGGTVYIACAQGMSRSVSVVLAYLVKHVNYSLRDAYFHVREVRPCIDVNRFFMIKLVHFERRIRKSTSVQLVRSCGRTWPDLPGF